MSRRYAGNPEIAKALDAHARAIGVRAHEGAPPRDHVPVLGTVREMAIEEPEQEPPVHGARSLTKAGRPDTGLEFRPLPLA